jgi:REP element-mobilizing transposase RayT
VASSNCNLLYHIVWSTKGRDPWLDATVRTRVHEYLGGAIRDEGGAALIINGTADHVHLLARLRQDKAVSAVIGAVKANSSSWVSRTFPQRSAFAWQEGYGAFTVSESQMEKVRTYIANQEKHHRAVSYLEEVKRLLTAHGVAFDERFL